MEKLKSLDEFKKAKHIVMKCADKGSAVVIMDHEQYILEAQRQLNDVTYYKKLDKSIYLQYIPLIQNILLRLKKKSVINTRQLQYLQGDLHPRERRFYFLPKIHEDEILKVLTLPSRSNLFSMDVANLYTKIGREEDFSQVS